MHLDELGTEVDLHELPIGAYPDVLPQVRTRNRVECLRDLDAMIGVDLDVIEVERHNASGGGRICGLSRASKTSHEPCGSCRARAYQQSRGTNGLRSRERARDR